MDLIEEEQGDCEEKDEGINPFNSANVTDYGVFLSFECLAMYCGFGDHLANHNAGDALTMALKRIRQEYPSISYDGYIAYCWSDVHDGDVVQYEISSKRRRKKDKGFVIYDFIGEALRKILEDRDAWEDLSESLLYTDENTLKKIIKLYHLYSSFVPSDSIERIIENSKKRDDSMSVSLQEFAEALRSGKDIDIEDDEIDTSNFSEGYMAALDMCILAEEISEEIPKRGVIMDAGGDFEIVIEAAESGDAEAKFTAGKYFIADHIEEEKERAIKWIREAADAGLEDAEEYIEEHSDMFE
jgi:ribosomal protein L7/L12